jgi:hypothetical protein
MDTRFITLEDMKELLGTTEEEEDGKLRQMWEEGLDECSCPLGRITYDDFRMFVKGQKREREPTSPIPKRASKRFVLEVSPLQAVPEGSMSPQAKHQVFAKFDQMPGLASLGMPLLGLPLAPLSPEPVGKNEEVDICFPADLPLKPVHRRLRSRSLGEPPLGEELDRYAEEERANENMRLSLPCVVRPSKAIGELQHVIGDESKSGREIQKALYRKHREFRQSVMIATKLFDQKNKARKLQHAQEASESTELGLQAKSEHHMPTRASLLVMKRGSDLALAGALEANSEHQPKKTVQDPVPNPVEVPMRRESDPHQHTKVADAARRSGRPRRPRQKTASDISGMLR